MHSAMSSSSAVKYKQISGDQSDHKLLKYVANRFRLTPLLASEIRCKRTCSEVHLHRGASCPQKHGTILLYGMMIYCGRLLWRVDGDIPKLLAICALFTSALILFAAASCLLYSSIHILMSFSFHWLTSFSLWEAPTVRGLGGPLGF